MLSSPLARLLLDRKPPSTQRVGVEVERFLLGKGGKPLAYSDGAELLYRSFLEREKDWEVELEAEGRPLALASGAHHLSVEPGGQVELAIAPEDSISSWIEQESQMEKRLQNAFVDPNWRWLFMGLNPWQSVEEVELLPLPRYGIMSRHYEKYSRRGREMMRLTTGYHINLDYRSSEEGMEMLRASTFLSPLMVAWFANSPFYLGKESGAYSERAMIWLGNDPRRSGAMELLFSDSTITDYVNLVESTPLMFYFDEEGKAHEAEGRSWRDLSSCLQEKNKLTALRQMFHEVRLKPCCVEFRSFDSVDPELRHSVVALVLGLLYDDETRAFYAKALQSTKFSDWPKKFEKAAKESLRNDYFYELAQEVFKKAEKGLVRRGLGEEKFLGPVEELLRTRESPAMKLLRERTFPL